MLSQLGPCPKSESPPQYALVLWGTEDGGAEPKWCRWPWILPDVQDESALVPDSTVTSHSDQVGLISGATFKTRP